MFVLGSLLDRRANPLLKHISRRASSMNPKDIELTTALKVSLDMVNSLLDQDIVRTCCLEDPFSDNVLLYTDGSFKNKRGWLGIVLVIDKKSIGFYYTFKDDVIHELAPRKHPINFLE